MIDVKPAAPFGAWERSLAFRYLRNKRKNGGVALIAIIAFTAIAIAVAVLIIVMSVMNGFREQLLSRILGFSGHAYVGGNILYEEQGRVFKTNESDGAKRLPDLCLLPFALCPSFR